MTSFRAAPFLLGLLLLSACRDKGAPPERRAPAAAVASTQTTTSAVVAPRELAVVASCDQIAEFSLCEEFDAAYLKGVDEKTLRTECVDDHGGKWRKDRCPSKGAVGRCKLAAEGGFAQVLYYGGKPPTYDTPQAECRRRADATLGWTAEYGSMP